ncbi:hypothetical protein BP5796_01528 [Coleophoma crateriformis]|uniref:GPI anchored protein n=1 Tax=Coleophoma crateriformis TaxID=565419 RepID=A0A3D8T0R9_9HELO|nr:hypothetical protein BP5796_01528 [Coleophoma crateriformis]
MYKHSVAALALLASVVSAQSTTSLYLIGFDQQPIDASIVGSDATATTYSLSCPSTTSAPVAAASSDFNSDICGVPTSMFVTQGPSTLHLAYSAVFESVTDAVTIGCDLSGTTSALCSGTEMLVNGTSTSTTVETTSYTGNLADMSTGLGAVAVTVLGSGSATAGSSASTGSSKATTKATGTASGASATGTSAQGTSTSTGGVPMVTGNAKWVVGGAAAAAGLAIAGF